MIKNKLEPCCISYIRDYFEGASSNAKLQSTLNSICFNLAYERTFISSSCSIHYENEIFILEQAYSSIRKKMEVENIFPGETNDLLDILKCKFAKYLFSNDIHISGRRDLEIHKQFLDMFFENKECLKILANCMLFNSEMQNIFLHKYFYWITHRSSTELEGTFIPFKLVEFNKNDFVLKKKILEALDVKSDEELVGLFAKEASSKTFLLNESLLRLLFDNEENINLIKLLMETN